MRCLETALGLALLALGATPARIPSCELCECYLSITGFRTADCLKIAITSIPPFPVDTQQIKINRGNISSLQGGEFNRYPNLAHIVLIFNPLTELPSGIFSKTVNVIKIDLEYNKLKILQSYLFSNLSYLETVLLRENHISVLEENCFFNNPRLNIINLRSNSLSKINQSFINDYSSLKQLHFSKNPVFCEDGICELMSRLVQHKLYEKDRWMPRCSGPPSVQNKTWAEAVEALWGAGPERCPAERRGPGSPGPQEPTRGADAELKDAGLQLLVAELNKSIRVLEALHTENLGLKAEQEKLKGVVDVLVRETQANRNDKKAAYGFFKTELNKSSRVLEKQEKLIGVVDVLVRETQANRNDQEAAYSFFKTELNKSSRMLEELHTENLGLKAEQEKLKGVVEAAYGFFKTDVNETRSELQLVKKDLHCELLALKEDVRTLLKQTKHGKDVANILFKKVYHSEGTGVLVLRYSVLPSPDNTSLPAP